MRKKSSGEDKSGQVVPYESRRDFVVDLYEGLLQRTPENHEVEYWVNVAAEKGTRHVLEQFVSSQELVERIKQTRDFAQNWSLSQYGEVELLLKLISKEVFASPTIVDVGAAGVDISNSIDLIATMGWRGLLIEANPHHAELLATEIAELNADVVCCAVAATEGEATFYLGRNHHLSSLNQEMAESWGDTQGEITVTKRRLHKILDEHNIPQNFAVLSLDIEGVDFEVLNDLINSSLYRPDWIIIEWGHTIFEATMDDHRLTDAVRTEYEIVGTTFSNILLKRIKN
jgi:FkbM family methyltransferase